MVVTGSVVVGTINGVVTGADLTAALLFAVVLGAWGRVVGDDFRGSTFGTVVVFRGIARNSLSMTLNAVVGGARVERVAPPSS